MNCRCRASETPVTTPSHSSLLERLQHLRGELPAVSAHFMEASRVQAQASAQHQHVEAEVALEYKR
jgi:hypothetical protein